LWDSRTFVTHHGSHFTVISYKHTKIILIVLLIMSYWYHSIKYRNMLELHYGWTQRHPTVVVYKKKFKNNV
jgi:hypothetical protein